jgi:hypothetical protein
MVMSERDAALPIACTLDTGSFEARLAQIGDLNARALTGSRRNDLTLTLEYRRDVIDDLLELVRAEQACCAFLAFRLDERGDKLVLTVTAPVAAREVVDMLFAQLEARY